MDKRSRTYKIYKAGVEAYNATSGDAPSPQSADMLVSIAAMLDFATKKPEKKDKETKKLLYTERDVIRCLNYDFTITKYGRLSGVLSNIKQRPEDLKKFTDWFNQSWYPWAQRNEVVLTYSMLCRKYPEWLEKAYQWSGCRSETTSKWV